MPLDELLTYDALSALTDPQSLSLGEDYFRSGAARDVTVGEDSIRAQVMGEELYSVAISASQKGGLNYSCICPYYEDEGVFCKHCVAVALTYIRDYAGFRTVGVDDDYVAPKRTPTRRVGKSVTADHLRDWLSNQSTDALAALIWEQSKLDADWRKRLFLRVASDTARGVNVAALRKTIEGATKARAYPDARQLKAFVQNVEEVAVTLKELLAIGEGQPVQELALFASDRVIEVYGRSRGAADAVREIAARLIEIYREAVQVAPPDPIELAAVLYERVVGGEYSFWKDALQTYAKRLGDEGIREFRSLLQADWAKIAPLTHENRRYNSYDPRRARIATLLESFARADNDTDALIVVWDKDLTTPDRYNMIVKALRDASRDEEACKWAERALAAFGNQTNQAVREFLIEQYRDGGENERALLVLWRLFEALPNVENYQSLRDFALPLGTWDEWRERAIQLLRERLTAQPARSTVASYHQEVTAADRLIALYLSEGDGDTAWALAQAHGTDDESWKQLAPLREATHPDEALTVYRRLLTKAIAAGTTHEIVELLNDLKTAHRRTGKEGDFAEYVTKLKGDHLRKRAFSAAIKTSGL